MPLLRLSPEQVAQVSGLVTQYITAQREKFLPQGLPLAEAQKAAMNGFFTPHLLDTTRIVVLTGVQVENPPFYPMLVGMGFSNLPNFSLMAAITFSDVVVSHGAFTNRPLFHELVHVEQYRQLGIPRFAELYVRGFLTGGSYDAIPLEVNAYNLDGRFQEQPNRRFSVEDEVGAWVRDNRF